MAIEFTEEEAAARSALANELLAKGKTHRVDLDHERDWATDFDHFDPRYAQDAPAIWRKLRESACPVAHGPAIRDVWMPTRHADVEAVARQPEVFSSRSPLVAQYGSMHAFGVEVPPISSDPPYHTGFRQLLLPFFAPKRIEAHRPAIEAHADALIDGFLATGSCDGAEDYAKHLPVRVIAKMLGVPDADSDRFTRWANDLIQFAPTDFALAAPGLLGLFEYFRNQVEPRRTNPGEDLLSFLATAELDGRVLSESEILGGCTLLLLAGIDTTWSAIGATLWHLGTHPTDQQRLRDEPDLWPSAIEEFLRLYAPVTMAREVVADTEFAGCPMRADDPVLVSFPSANRDPDVFDQPDEAVLDRARNRHLAFGSGIHRCLGSNLARLELTVAVQTFLDRVPPFTVADPDAVRWSVGQVRGPRVLPLTWCVKDYHQ